MTLIAVPNDIGGCSVRFGVGACCVRRGVGVYRVRFGVGACCVRFGVGACSVRRGMAVRSLSFVIPSPARNLAPAQRAARLARLLRFLSALRSVRNDIRYTLRASSHPPSPRLLQHRNDINRRPAYWQSGLLAVWLGRRLGWWLPGSSVTRLERCLQRLEASTYASLSLLPHPPEVVPARPNWYHGNSVPWRNSRCGQFPCFERGKQLWP